MFKGYGSLLELNNLILNLAIVGVDALINSHFKVE